MKLIPFIALSCAIALAACAATPQPAAPASSATQPISTRPVGHFDWIGAVSAPTRPAAPAAQVSPTFASPLAQDDGLRATLRLDPAALDAVGSAERAAALAMLRDFTDPDGPYQGAWWFVDDGQAHMDEALAMILFTEGSVSLRVQEAVAARYVWYCGEAGTQCQGRALVNFLAYFQPWREPWMTGGHLLNPAAQAYLPRARAVLGQPADSVDWGRAPFHFANVHLTWDRYLQDKLRRASNGPNRLWVLTQAEAERVCPTALLCPDMTRPRS
jgi:hypothetical protein